jgi:hypothetical protein
MFKTLLICLACLTLVVNTAGQEARVALRAKSGTAGEVLDALAADIRANPSDWSRLDRYLRANNYAGNVQDVKWLADSICLLSCREEQRQTRA